jgi:thioesterase domain-containing protein/acyl carrier protein
MDLKAIAAGSGDLPPLFRGLVPVPRRRAAAGKADSASLLRQLAGLDAAEQDRVLLDVVLRFAATLLGHADPADVDPERDFLESGFDSLTALELRNSLNEATGLRLPPMAVFDNKTPAELARWIRGQLAGHLDGVGQEQPARAAGAGDTLSDLFRAAVYAGKTDKGFELLRAAADIRPTFTSPADLERIPASVRLADGPARPRLICVSTPMATGGVHQHARLVSNFRTPRHVSALPLAGFARGESLPASVDAAVAVLAESVLQAADGDPFVLLGYSSGGAFAYAAARHLETELGVTPAGVVMMDTFRVDGGGSGLPMDQLAFGLFEKESAFGGFDSARLSGMAAWCDVMLDLAPGEVAAPVLFVQSTEPFYTAPGEAPPDSGQWQATPWDPAHAVRTVRANHFTLVEEKAAQTAEVIEDWLGTLG